MTYDPSHPITLTPAQSRLAHLLFAIERTGVHDGFKSDVEPPPLHQMMAYNILEYRDNLKVLLEFLQLEPVP